MQSNTIRVQDLNIHFRVLGSGPDVLFIHGWASSGRMWHSAMQALAPRFRCWALDLAGFGDSDKPTDGWYAIPNFTASVRGFAGAMGVAQADIVGHSMGGMIALDLAARHPDFVRRLIAVNPVVTGRVRLQIHALAGHLLDRRLLSLTWQVWPALHATPLRQWIPEHFWRDREEWSKATVESALGGLRAIAGYDTTPLLSRIVAPALIVVGARDMIIAPREGRLAARLIANARLVELRSGHTPTDDRPDEINSLLSSFLAPLA